MKAAIASEKGIRPTFEDAHFLDLNFAGEGWAYGGVYDGHNGDYAAKYAAENLHRVVLEKMLAGLSPRAAFTEAYQSVSAAVSGQDSGTTAVDFLIKDGRIITANAGDARAIVLSHGGHTQLTVDHRVDDPEERKGPGDGGRDRISLCNQGSPGACTHQDHRRRIL